jgi:hypothetical protein
MAIGSNPASAFGPSKSDGHPPGALFQSSPSGARQDDASGGKLNPPVDLRRRAAVHSMRSANVRLNAGASLHHGTTRHHQGS